MTKLTLGLLCGALALLAACQREAPLTVAREPRVLASFYPLTYFAQRIAGDRVPVSCPLPIDADPIFWMPSRPEVAVLQDATLTLVNGASFEQWTDKVSLPASRVVDTTVGLKDRLLKFATTTHTHGPGGAHTHEGIDGHTWLDPLHAKVQAKAIEAALARAFPQHTTAFAQGLAGLERDLDALHARFTALTPQLAGVKLLAAHPAYNYIAARYGWQIENLDIDPAAPLANEARDALGKAKASAVRAVLLFESTPLPATAATIEALGVRCVVFDPAENVTAGDLAAGDYLTIMGANLDRLVAAATR